MREPSVLRPKDIPRRIATVLAYRSREVQAAGKEILSSRGHDDPGEGGPLRRIEVVAAFEGVEVIE